jgi:hypothetical protein
MQSFGDPFDSWDEQDVPWIFPTCRHSPEGCRSGRSDGRSQARLKESIARELDRIAKSSGGASIPGNARVKRVKSARPCPTR